MGVQTLNARIEGMSCTSCAANIEKKLSDLESVIMVQVNFATNKAKIAFEDTVVNRLRIEAIIKKLGFSICWEEGNTTKISMHLKGMRCTSCSSKIEKEFNELDGISSVSVSLASEKIIFTYDPSIIKLMEIKEVVSKLGFELAMDESSVIDKEEVKIKQAKNLALLSLSLFAVMMSLMLLDMFVVKIPCYLLIVALLGFPVVFVLGGQVHRGSIKAIKNKSPNMNVLVSLGSFPPYIIGLMGLFLPVQSFIEMATMIMTFHLVGKYLETRAKGKASMAIKKLLEMGAKQSTILVGGEEVEVMVDELQVGDVMVVRTGDKIPTDGRIVEGYGLLDESMVTGESIAIRREVGEEVIGGTINRQGLLYVEVTKVGSETFLAQVIHMVEECQGSKVPIQEFSDRVTGYFVPAILVISTGTFISYNLFPDFHLGIITWGAQFLPWVNPNMSPLGLAFVTTTAVLVISCPCALGLGTPTALMVGSGMGAEKGILIRNGEAIQTFKEVKTIAFDKTGTITKGKPEVTDIIVAGQMMPQQTLMRYVAALENASKHPLGEAVVSYAKKQKITIEKVEQFEALAGKGISGTVRGKQVVIGSRKLMSEYGIEYEKHEKSIENLEEQAKTVIMVAIDNTLEGMLAIADPIKEDSKKAIKVLEDMGIQTVMITGDNARTASAIGKEIGIGTVISEVLPDGKVREVQNLQEKYGAVAMVGDGINDAPALKQANVGIAIGTGTDIAIEAADVTLVRGELSGIISAIKLSEATLKKIKQNYFWAWIYNALFIPVAIMGLLHPMIGAAAMACSSLNVIYNSLRLKKQSIEAYK